METWIPILVATLSAVLSGVFAVSARRSDHEAQRLRELEQRNAERKYATYQPMLELLRELLTPGAGKDARPEDEVTDEISKFAQWILVWGSDEAVLAFHRFMQSAFGGAPTTVALHMYGQLVPAARRDMGHAKTDITLEHVIAQRLTDAYTDQTSWDAFSLSEDQLFEKYDFSPPWKSRPPRAGLRSDQ